MKQRERCSGRGFDSPRLHQKHNYGLRSWSYQRGETATQVSMLLMGATGLDRAKSIRVDSTVGDLRKRSKSNRRKR